MDMYVAPSAAAILSQGGESKQGEADEDTKAILDYHRSASAYMERYRSLTSFVAEMQTRIKGLKRDEAGTPFFETLGGSNGGNGESSDDDSEPVEVVMNKDHGEGLDKAKPIPDWLDTLVKKYFADTDAVVPSSGSPIDSLGKFAMFTASCLFNRRPASLPEVTKGTEVRAGCYSTGDLPYQLLAVCRRPFLCSIRRRMHTSAQ